jgi:hypothetical protein
MCYPCEKIGDLVGLTIFELLLPEEEPVRLLLSLFFFEHLDVHEAVRNQIAHAPFTRFLKEGRNSIVRRFFQVLGDAVVLCLTGIVEVPTKVLKWSVHFVSFRGVSSHYRACFSREKAKIEVLVGLLFWRLSFLSYVSVYESSESLAAVHLLAYVFRRVLNGLDRCFGQGCNRVGHEGDRCEETNSAGGFGV